MNTLLFNKPFHVLSQFTDVRHTASTQNRRQTLADFIDRPNFYPAGRLDFDSEGLLLLTNDGQLQSRISHPKFKLEKQYWVQVESLPTDIALNQLRAGIVLKDGTTKPARVQVIAEPSNLWPRNPPVADHRQAKACWINIGIREGRNRQVRRMFATVETPVLRLIRHQIGEWSVCNIPVGQYQSIHVHLPNGPSSRPLPESLPKRRTKTPRPRR